MTERHTRLRRLVSLREQEHARSVGTLRLAQQELTLVAVQLQATRDEQHHYAHVQTTAIANEQHDLWLVSRAETEIRHLEISRAMTTRRQKELVVAMAMESERESRCAFRQMEHLMERVHREEGVAAMRSEQQQIDEAARLLRGPMSHNSLP